MNHCMSLILMTILGLYICDVCQIEKHASDGGNDVVKRMGCSKEKNIMLHLYEFVLSERQN